MSKVLDFFKQRRFVEVRGPSGHRQIMSKEEYILKLTAEKRAEALLIHQGIFVRREPDHLVEHVMRRRTF
jgi:hypothetical protein